MRRGKAADDPGYSKPLYLMAFDHCGSFEHDLLGAPPLRGLIADRAERSAAVRQIADRYLETLMRFVV